MIRTVADLLQGFASSARAKLPGFEGIQHPGIFGEMYEGLTKDLLNRALFEGLDLRVVSGKIRHSDHALSRQIDCMVVIGSGEEIPFTSHYIYPIDKVVMVVEVKKTLYGAELRDALELFWEFKSHLSEPLSPKTGLVEDSWRGLFGQNLPTGDELHTRPFSHQMIFHTLVVESCLPVRVVFGYDGYVDEFGLRQALIDILSTIVTLPLAKRPRFNVSAFPNLIVCRDNCLFKLDGFPYRGAMAPDDWWIWFASRHFTPLYTLLEMLWTRLAYLFKLSPTIFGEDLEIEVGSPLLAARAVKSGDITGWEYQTFEAPREQLEATPDREQWEPPDLSMPEFVAVNILCRDGDISLDDPDFAKFAAQHDLTISEVAASLRQKQLATIADNKITLLTDDCACMVMPDGRLTAAENKSGRLLRYAMKVSEERRRGQSSATLS